MTNEHLNPINPTPQDYEAALTLRSVAHELGMLDLESEPEETKQKRVSEAALGISLLRQDKEENRRTYIRSVVGVLSERSGDDLVKSRLVEHLETALTHALGLPPRQSLPKSFYK